jgi:hypothetical protein
VYECRAFDGLGNSISKKFFVTLKDIERGNHSVPGTDSQQAIEQMAHSGNQSFCPGWLSIVLFFIYQTADGILFSYYGNI